MRLKASSANVGASTSNFLPQVTGSYGYDAGNSSRVNNFSGTTLDNVGSGDGIRQTQSVSVRATQNIFSGMERLGRVQAAKADKRFANWSLEEVKAQISRDLKAAVAQLHFAQKRIRLSRQIIQRRNENNENVELRYEGGNENKGSYLLATASLESARFEEMQAKNDLEVARQDLARVLGREDGSEITVTGMPPVSAPKTADQNWEKLAAETPQYRQAEAQAKNAAAGVTVARSGFLPSVDASTVVTKRLDDRADGDVNWSAGLDVTLPIFNGLNNYYSTRSAAATHRAARYNQASVRQKNLTSIKDAWNSYVESVKALEVSRKLLDAARARAEISRSRYNNGLITFENWDIIENDLISRERAMLETERDRVIAEANWELAQGRNAFP